MTEDPHDPTIGAMAHFVRGRLAAEAGDTAAAATEMEAFGAANADPIVSTGTPGYICWIAPAEEAAGHPDKADAVLKTGGSYVDCYRFRGDILDQRGDWPAAQRAYADAVALAPDLPAGYYSWGVALAVTAILRAPRPSSRMQTSARRIGPIRSRRGVMCW
jgi:tetratricopeptide (TPR) repeat protein